MATNELIITELVFRNVFTEKDPAEIAALLSCFVFQAKTREDGNQLPDNLADGVKAIEQIESELGNIEAKFMVSFIRRRGFPELCTATPLGVFITLMDLRG